MYNDKQLPASESVRSGFREYRMLTLQVFVLGGLLSIGYLQGEGPKVADLDGPEGPAYRPAGLPNKTADDGPEGPASNRRSATPRVATGKLDAMGREISVSCASCHANFKPALEVQSADGLKQFHQGLKFSHGKLTCLTCHNAKNYNLLRLASDQALDFGQAQTLCSQCHSKQSIDYERAAHGGMNGYWNAVRGVRIRKQCIDCHDPHAPAFPAMIPTFKPHDRFLESNHPSHSSGSPHE